jgi:hypothetical protein
MQAKRNKADHAEKREEVAKDAYELCQPQSAERFLPQHVF